MSDWVHTLSFPAHESAKQAARELQMLGWMPYAGIQCDGSDSWVVSVYRPVEVTADLEAGATRFFEGVAKRNSGVYVGAELG